MKRKKPLNRKKPFANRGSGLRRKGKLSQRRGPRRSAAWEFRADRDEFTATVLDASRGLCVVSSEPADEAHHVIPKQAIRRFVSARVRDGTFSNSTSRDHLRRLLWDTRNGIAVSRRVHAEHENRKRPIPRRCIPESAIAFARELGLVWMIERDYPEEEEDAA